MSSSIFKYIPQKYLDQYIEEGQILFRPLKYFIDEYKEQDGALVRNDPSEGSVEFDVKDVEELTINEKKIEIIPNSLVIEQKYKNPQNFFIHCLSKKLSPKLFNDFKTDRCIEIVDKDAFLEMLKSTITFSEIYNDDVEYQDVIEVPDKKLFFYKKEKYIDQSEYRICFTINNLDENNEYHHSFVCEPGVLMCSRFSEIVPKIGNLSKIVKIHKES